MERRNLLTMILTWAFLPIARPGLFFFSSAILSVVLSLLLHSASASLFSFIATRFTTITPVIPLIPRAIT